MGKTGKNVVAPESQGGTLQRAQVGAAPRMHLGGLMRRAVDDGGEDARRKGAIGEDVVNLFSGERMSSDERGAQYQQRELGTRVLRRLRGMVENNKARVSERLPMTVYNFKRF